MTTLKINVTAAEKAELARLIALRGPGDAASLNRVFGQFRYRNLAGGQVQIIDPAWTGRNIVALVPGKDLINWPVTSATGRVAQKVWMHRLIATPLKIALRIMRDNGVRFRTFDGLWVPRHQLHNPNYPLSVHSWGGAVDFDVAWNGYGRTPQLSPVIAAAMESVGFAWGGRWSAGRADGMHFEFCDLVPGVVRPQWQDAAIR